MVPVRRFVCCLLALCAILISVSARAQAPYPSRPLTMIVSVGAGGTGDVYCRLIAADISRRLGQSVVVENKPGAGSVLAVDSIMRAAPDGYTIGYVANNLLTYHLLSKNPRYVLLRDVAPIAKGVEGSVGLVVNSAKLPARTLAEFLEQARANPGKLNYGSAGVGSASHMAAEWLLSETGVKVVHVPYKSSPDLTNAVVGGQVDVTFLAPNTFRPHVANGVLRALAMTSPRRSELAPGVPTLTELGANIVYTYWFGFAAPNGTSRDIINRLNREILAAHTQPEIRAKLLSMGFEPVTGTPEQFAADMQREIASLAKIIKLAGIEPE